MVLRTLLFFDISRSKGLIATIKTSIGAPKKKYVIGTTQRNEIQENTGKDSLI